MKVTLQDIEKAEEKIRPYIQKTPIQHSASASQTVGSEIYLKFENQQTTGSFKIRGAMNSVIHLSEEQKSRGVIASSAGNHAQGVAYSARAFKTQAHIVMPKTASLLKQQATQGYGAQVYLHGDIYDEAFEYAQKLAQEKGYFFIPPYEHPHVIAGQGTLGLEILKDLPQVKNIIVPIGGGGLISGLALAVKSIRPDVRIYGVVASLAPAMMALFKKQPLPQAMMFPSIADGISIKKPSPVIYESFIHRYVDDIVDISEDEIASAIVFLLERAKTVVEGSGAISLAAAFSKKLKLVGPTCVLLCGGNIDLNLVAQIIDRGLSRSGRLAKISVIVPDRPGQLTRVTQVVAQAGANILHVVHDRLADQLHIRETAIHLSLETKDAQHIQNIQLALKQAGFVLMS